MNTNNQFESITEAAKVNDPYFDDVLPEINEELNKVNLSLLQLPVFTLVAFLYIMIWFAFFQ